MSVVAHAPRSTRATVSRLTSAFADEKALVGPALGLAAVAIVDDNFVHPDSEHTGGLEAQPIEYERRVIEFLDNALLSDHEGSTP